MTQIDVDFYAYSRTAGGIQEFLGLFSGLQKDASFDYNRYHFSFSHTLFGKKHYNHEYNLPTVIQFRIRSQFERPDIYMGITYGEAILACEKLECFVFEFYWHKNGQKLVHKIIWFKSMNEKCELEQEDKNLIKRLWNHKI